MLDKEDFEHLLESNGDLRQAIADVAEQRELDTLQTHFVSPY